MMDKNQDTKRLFFGLDLPNDKKDLISNWLATNVSSSRKPVRKANLHLTLAFLPNVNTINKKKLVEFANQIIATPFKLRFSQTDYWQKTGIFFLKPNTTPKALSHLAHKLRDKGEALGIYNNPFAYHPHITLMRGCKQQPIEIKPLPPIEVSFTQFTLFHSTRIENTLCYRPIRSFSLT